MNTNINLLIQKLLPYFYIFIFAYFINAIISFYLPKEDINFIEESTKNLQYKNFSGFYSNQVKVENKQTQVKEKKSFETLDKYLLKAIYSTDSNSGWISVEDTKTNKSVILSQWEEIDGYILTKLFKNYVIFEKSAKEYKLVMKKTDDENITYEVSKTDNNIKENIIVRDNIVEVKRDYLNSYVSDIDKVWNNISINEVRKDGKIEGFKVDKVVKDSVFEKLGLKKGDIIKAINNNVLSSYADAFKVYNNISNTNYLNIEILRNNEVMELNYEIN